MPLQPHPWSSHFAAFVFATLCTLNSLAQLSTENVTVDGQTRSFLKYLPVNFDPSEQLPLMMCFHGGSGTAEEQLAIGDLRETADEDRFLLLYPQALPDPNDEGSTNWQVVTSGDLPFTLPNPHSDIDFVSALIDAMLAMHNIDASRVYAMGYSNGGGFVYDLACRLNDKVTGVGAVARTMYAESYDECTVSHPTPVVNILGTNDFISSYDGITYEGTLYYHSAEATHDFWIEQNGLFPQAEISTVPDLNPSDNTSVELYQWQDEQNCRELAHYKVNGGDHDWPGTFGNMDIVSHDMIWAHLKEFDMNGRMSCGTDATLALSPMEWTLYPNPASNRLVLDMKRFGAAAEKYRMFDSTGQLVMEGQITSQRTSIDLSTLPCGLHWLKVGMLTKRFVIQ